MTIKSTTQNEHYQDDNNLLSNLENYQNDNAKKSLEEKSEIKRRKNLTKEEIIQAIKSLEANNEEITIVKIYDKLQNRGSYRTIIKVKKEYEQAKIERELELKRNDIKREEITQAVTHIVEDAYLANREYVRIQLSKAQETVNAIKTKSEVDLNDLAIKNEELEDKLHEIQLENIKLKNKLKETQEALDKCMKELQSEKLNSTQLKTQLEYKLKEYERLQKDLEEQKEKNKMLLKEVIAKIQIKA